MKALLITAATIAVFLAVGYTKGVSKQAEPSSSEEHPAQPLKRQLTAEEALEALLDE